MTKEQYRTMTETTRRLVCKLPGGARLLAVPACLCAVVYMLTLAYLAWQRDVRFFRASLVPAACFLIVTILRPLIGRERPYDRFQLPPVGKWEQGKGKSMPSRHAASAVAVAIAVVYIFPSGAMMALMAVLTVLVCTFRICSGQHYPSDVAAALLLTLLLSAIGYGI